MERGIDDKQLIQLVGKHECLFNHNNGDYSKNKLKLMIWDQIGNELGYPGSACKYRWFNLRDQFRRFLKNKTNVKRQWRHLERMSFLLPFFREKGLEDQVKVEEINFMENENYMMSSEDESIKEENLEINPLSLLDTNVTESSFNSSLQLESRKRKLSQNDESSSMISEPIKQNESLDGSKPKHLVDLFLSSISETIKTFPLLYQHMAKKKIFDIVSDLEMQLLVKSETSTSTSIQLPMQQPETENFRLLNNGETLQ